MTNDIHSMVIASDYRVPDPTRVWPLLERNKAALADIGAHHVLVYTSTHDHGRVLVMIGVHSREPIVELLRSRVFFDWFDAAGVDDIPAVFAGEIIDRFVAEPPSTSTGAGGRGGRDRFRRRRVDPHRRGPRCDATGLPRQASERCGFSRLSTMSGKC